MTLVQLTSPSVEPVALSDFKAHARIDNDEEDALIAAMLLAARAHIETLSGKVFVTQTWRIIADEVPPDGRISLLLRPIQSIDAITVYDSSGSPTSLEPEDWLGDLGGRWPRLMLRRPAATRMRAMNGIEIDVTAGYGPSGFDVPAVLRHAIVMLASHWYAHRATGFDFTAAGEPDGLFDLIEPYREISL